MPPRRLVLVFLFLFFYIKNLFGHALLILTSWKTLCNPKVEGYLGFRRVNEFNLSLLAFWHGMYRNKANQCITYKRLGTSYIWCNFLQWYTTLLHIKISLLGYIFLLFLICMPILVLIGCYLLWSTNSYFVYNFKVWKKKSWNLNIEWWDSY